MSTTEALAIAILQKQGLNKNFGLEIHTPIIA